MFPAMSRFRQQFSGQWHRECEVWSQRRCTGATIHLLIEGSAPAGPCTCWSHETPTLKKIKPQICKSGIHIGTKYKGLAPHQPKRSCRQIPPRRPKRRALRVADPCRPTLPIPTSSSHKIPEVTGLTWGLCERETCRRLEPSGMTLGSIWRRMRTEELAWGWRLSVLH